MFVAAAELRVRECLLQLELRCGGESLRELERAGQNRQDGRLPFSSLTSLPNFTVSKTRA